MCTEGDLIMPGPLSQMNSMPSHDVTLHPVSTLPDSLVHQSFPSYLYSVLKLPKRCLLDGNLLGKEGKEAYLIS